MAQQGMRSPDIEVGEDSGVDSIVPGSDEDSHDVPGSDEDSHDVPGLEEDSHEDSIHCFLGHTGPVFAVSWNPYHPTFVASGGGDDRAYLWQTTLGDLGPETTTSELTGHTDSVACLSFSHSGDLLASGGLDGRVQVWSVPSARCTHVLDGPTGGIEWLSWHPKGDVVLAGSEDFSIWMWNAASGAFMQIFTGHSGAVRCGQFTPDGKFVLSGGGEGDNSLKLWDPKNGTCEMTISDPHTYHSAGLTVLAVHPDSVTACTASEDRNACLVNLQTRRVLGILQGHTDSIEAVGFITSHNLVATASIDGDVRVWDAPTLSSRFVCHHPEAVVGLLSHPSLPLMYTACLDGLARSWDTRTGECLQTKHGHSEGIQCLALSPCGGLLLTGSDDGTARIFEFR